MSETHIVGACLDLLGAYKVFAFRNNTGAFKTERGGFVRFGCKGSPDIIAVYGGQFIGVECKDKTKQSESQKEFQKNLEEANGIYWLVHSSEELEQKLKELI